MIKAIQAKPITGMSFSPTSAQESQSESVAAPAEVGQGLGTHHDLCECRTCISKSPTCAACGSTNTEFCCHPAEFCQAICNDCNKPLNADGSVWVESNPLPVEVPESDTLWQLLTGCSLNRVRSCLMCGDPELEQDADRVRQAAQDAWAQIRAEVGA